MVTVVTVFIGHALLDRFVVLGDMADADVVAGVPERACDRELGIPVLVVSHRDGDGGRTHRGRVVPQYVRTAAVIARAGRPGAVVGAPVRHAPQPGRAARRAWAMPSAAAEVCPRVSLPNAPERLTAAWRVVVPDVEPVLRTPISMLTPAVIPLPMSPLPVKRTRLWDALESTCRRSLSLSPPSTLMMARFTWPETENSTAWAAIGRASAPRHGRAISFLSMMILSCVLRLHEGRNRSLRWIPPYREDGPQSMVGGVHVNGWHRVFTVDARNCCFNTTKRRLRRPARASIPAAFHAIAMSRTPEVSSGTRTLPRADTRSPISRRSGRGTSGSGLSIRRCGRGSPAPRCPPVYP